MPNEESSKTVSTTQDPWGPQQPYLTEGFEQAKGLLDQGPKEYYPGQTVTDTTGQTAQGQFATFDQATRANDLNKYTMGGGFLDAGNPYFQGMVGQIGQAIRPSIDSAFAGSGRLGSGAHANAYASSLADQAGKLAYQNYGQERQNQIGAAQDYSAGNAMMGVGQQIEAKDGQYIQDAMNRWQFAQNAPQEALTNYMNVVGNRSYGGSGTSTQPYTSNPTMQALGTGASALGALGSFGQSIPGLLKLFGG